VRRRYVSTAEEEWMREVWWSNPQEEVQLGSVAADVNLPDVVLPGEGGRIHRVYAVFKFRMVENTNVAVNANVGATNIRVKKSTGAWGVDDVAAINLVDNMFGLAASTREGGDVVIGDNDVSGEVDAFGATYNLRWEDGAVDQNNLNFNDVQSGLIVEWR